MTAADLTVSAEAWDAALAGRGGHLLQSWRWGEFKSLHGWTVRRIAVERDGTIALAQVLFRRKGPFSLAYIPRGPAIDAPGSTLAVDLFTAIDLACAAERAAFLIVEPDRPLPFSGAYREAGFVRGPEHLQPARTVKIPLLDDEALLGQMHQKTRYSVRLAERRGVVYERANGNDPAAIDRFYTLLEDTSERNAFGIHQRDYYSSFMKIFQEDALLAFASTGGVDGAALIAAKFGREAIYMYGGSSTEHRAHGAAFGLQFDAMRWAREAGCRAYDLWGIPKSDPEPAGAHDGQLAGSKGEDWRGLFKFKTGFGGEIVCYPATLERRYRPLIAFVARRFAGNRGG